MGSFTSGDDLRKLQDLRTILMAATITRIERTEGESGVLTLGVERKGRVHEVRIRADAAGWWFEHDELHTSSSTNPEGDDR